MDAASLEAIREHAQLREDLLVARKIRGRSHGMYSKQSRMAVTSADCVIV